MHSAGELSLQVVWPNLHTFPILLMLEKHRHISHELGPSTPTISFLGAQLTWVSPAFSWHLAAATPSLGGVEGLRDRALPIVKTSEAEALASVCGRTGRCTGHCRHPVVMLSSPFPFSMRKVLFWTLVSRMALEAGSAAAEEGSSPHPP